MTVKYKDLPQAQKKQYLKKLIIDIIITDLPLIIFGLAIILTVNNMPKLQTPETILELQNSNQINQFTLKILNLFTISFIFALFSLIAVGSFLGTAVTNKLKLYTNKDLEKAEKKVNEIKDAIANAS